MLSEEMVEHPRTTCTALRKDGEQLSKDEKKALGLRSNAFLSRFAFAQLTDKGLAEPLAAHETTLLRAVFTLSRFQTIRRMESADLGKAFIGEYKIDVLNMECPSCKARDGTITTEPEQAVFPASDCICPTANYSLQPYVDWLREIE